MREGATTWVAIGVLLAAILLFDGWLVLAHASPGRVAGSLSEVAARDLEGGRHVVLAAGEVHEGDVLSCTTHGLRVAARVPQPGRTVRQHIPSPTRGGATITIATRPDGSVYLGCRD